MLVMQRFMIVQSRTSDMGLKVKKSDELTTAHNN